MRQTVYDIVDSREYAATNCYQHQLGEVLDDEFEIKRFSLAELHYRCIPEGSVVLSRLKLRTFFNNMSSLQPILAKTKLFVYEQDTWENFLVGSPYFGAYQAIAQHFPVASFLNMSYWWAELVRSIGLPAVGVKPWALPRYCTEPIPWSKRTHDVVFCGTLYPERRIFIDSLRDQGVNIEVLPAGKDYPSYLDLLSHSKIAIRSERKDWKIDAGNGPYVIPFPHAQWQRDIETAARGCVSMRETDLEAVRWGVGEVPSIMTFEDARDAAATIDVLLKNDDATMDDLVARSIKVVKNDRGYRTVTDAIKEML